MMDYKNREDYPKEFLAAIPDLLLVGLGGSHAYGTATASSDLDIRGFYRNPPEELIGFNKDSAQIIDLRSDTTIYSFKKMLELLSNCNPNTIEILGLRPEHYLFMTDEGKLVLEQKEIFLSKKAIYTFGQYALSQLNRLINKSGRAKSEVLQNEQRSLSKSMAAMEARYHKPDMNVFFEIKGEKIFANINFREMPIEEIVAVLSEFNAVHKDYAKSSRNNKAVVHNKLNKHMMHLLRLYMMGIDILEKHKIITYREGADHDLLMEIRNNKYLKDDNCTPTKEFELLLQDYKRRFDAAASNTTLPEKPDYNKINELAITVNKMRKL